MESSRVGESLAVTESLAASAVSQRLAEASKKLTRLQKGKGISSVIDACRQSNAEIKALKKENNKVLKQAKARRTRLVKRIEGIDQAEATSMMELFEELKTRRDQKKHTKE